MIKEHLNAVLVEELTYSSISIEYLSVNFIVAATKAIVGIWYRPPNTNSQQFMLDLAAMKSVIALKYSNHTIISMGDINLNLLKINTNNQVLEYYLTMLSAGFYHLVLRRTRVTSRSATVIDYNWSSINEFMKKIRGFNELYFCSLLTFTCFDLTVQKAVIFFQCTRRVSNVECVITFQNKLMSSNWSPLYTLGTVGKIYENYYEMFRIYDECFAIVTRFKRKKDC